MPTVTGRMSAFRANARKRPLAITITDYGQHLWLFVGVEYTLRMSWNSTETYVSVSPVTHMQSMTMTMIALSVNSLYTWGCRVLGTPPWLEKAIRSMHKMIDLGVPLRSLAA